MQIKKIYVDGFKRLLDFNLALNPNLNVLVGDNETGKTTILEAIRLVLSRQYDGHRVDFTLDPYLFNQSQVKSFFSALRAGGQHRPPRVLIEAYLVDDGSPEAARYTGTQNTKAENCPGLWLKLEVDTDHGEALLDYARDPSNPELLPAEFYRVTWKSFSGDGVTNRDLVIKTKTIDTTLTRTQHGPNRYVSQLVGTALTREQYQDLSLAYRKLRHGFSEQDGVKEINKLLSKQGQPKSPKLTVDVDMSARTKWESAITPHLDELPFDCAGKGQQCKVQMRLALADSEPSQVILVEEPENHLSHGGLQGLIADMEHASTSRQLIVATHSAFVLNKLGINSLQLISEGRKTFNLSQLSTETRDYFVKLPGYDTLRLVLAAKAILVEGPSDELIVQRAYLDKYGTMPLALKQVFGSLKTAWSGRAWLTNSWGRVMCVGFLIWHCSQFLAKDCDGRARRSDVTLRSFAQRQ